MSATTLLLGIRILDPGLEIDAIHDVLISDGVVSKLDAPGTGATWAEHPDNGALGTLVISQSDFAHELILTPGLIDIHTHSFGSAGVNRPDAIGVESGVPIIADAGGAGPATIDDFIALQTPSSKTRIKTFMSIESGGITDSHRGHNTTRCATAMTTSSLDAFLGAIERHQGTIVGLKVWAAAAAGIRWIDHATNLSEMIELPMLVHVGELEDPNAESITGDVIDRLQGGDIVTHSFTGLPGALISQNGNILPEAMAARGRGVLFDIAPGERNLSFDRAELAMEQGWLPDTISSEVHHWARAHNPFMSLPYVMSMFLALGLSLRHTVKCATTNAADAIGINTGECCVGGNATLSLMARQETPAIFSDGNRSIHGQESLIPVGSFLDGEWTEATASEIGHNTAIISSPECEKFFAALGGELAHLQRHDSRWRGEELHRLVHRARTDCGLDIAETLTALHDGMAPGAPTMPAGWLLEQLGPIETMARLDSLRAEGQQEALSTVS